MSADPHTHPVPMSLEAFEAVGRLQLAHGHTLPAHENIALVALMAEWAKAERRLLELAPAAAVAS